MSLISPSWPVLVQHFDNFVEDEEVPPPPTSPFLAEEGAAAGAPTTGFVRVGHSASGPSQPLRKRGNKAGKAKQTFSSGPCESPHASSRNATF